MNHIGLVNELANNPARPQGIEVFYPYPTALTCEQGYAAFLADAERESKILAVLSGTNEVRTCVKAAAPPLFYVGRNFSGDPATSSISVLLNGAAGLTYRSRLIPTGSTPALPAQFATRDLITTGGPFSRQGLVPAGSPAPYGSLHQNVPNGTYTLQLLRADGSVLQSAALQVSNTGPELAFLASSQSPDPPDGVARLQPFARVTADLATPSPGGVIPTQKLLMYNLMNEDGPGRPNAQGVYLNDNYGIAEYVRDGTSHAFIPEWPGNAFSIHINSAHYQKSRTEWNRHVMYQNQRAAIRAAGKKYCLRPSFSRDELATDTITTPANVMRDQNGAVAEGGVPGLHLLRSYVEGGETDTNNPWHYLKAYIRKVASDFKQDIEDGVCFGMMPTLTARMEDTMPKDNNAPGNPLYIGDYSAGAIADFKARMNVTQDPPKPGTYNQSYLGIDMYVGSIGKKWFRYREDMYLYFKQQVRRWIQEVVPGCPLGDEWGQIFHADPINGAVANLPKLSAGSRLAKFNPSFDGNINFHADLFRSNTDAGTLLMMEADQDWVVNNPFDRPNATAKNPIECTERLERYLARGIGVVSFGQCNYTLAWNNVKAVAAQLAQRGFGGPIVQIPQPPADKRISYTLDQMMSQDLYQPQASWFAAGGSDTVVIEEKIVDTLTL